MSEGRAHLFLGRVRPFLRGRNLELAIVPAPRFPGIVRADHAGQDRSRGETWVPPDRGYSGGLVSGTSFTAYGVPAAQQRATDLHGLFVSAIAGANSFRTVIEYFGALGARTVALPSALPVPTLTALTGPYKRLQFQFTLPSDLAQSTTLLYSDLGSGSSVYLIATVAGYLGGQAVNLSVPDFSSVGGWSNAWAPASSATVTWTASGTGLNLPAACANNGRLVTGTQLGTI